MTARNEHGLTLQQEAFARAVASGKTQSDAYRIAYPKSKTWKDTSVNVNASQMLADTNIAQRVAILAAKVEEKFAIDTAKLLQEASALAHSDIANIMHPDGRVKLPNELDAATRAAVASFKIDEYGRIEYKFWDKNSAHERLFKHKGLFEIDNKQKTDPLIDFAKTLRGDIAGPGTLQIPEDDD